MSKAQWLSVRKFELCVSDKRTSKGAGRRALSLSLRNGLVDDGLHCKPNFSLQQHSPRFLSYLHAPVTTFQCPNSKPLEAALTEGRHRQRQIRRQKRVAVPEARRLRPRNQRNHSWNRKNSLSLFFFFN